MQNYQELRKEWHRLSERLDRIHVESEKTYWSDGGLQALYRERNAIHRRIAEIVALGVTFEDVEAMREL